MTLTKDNLPKPILDYISFMNHVDAEKTPWVTKERIKANFDNYGKAMNTFLLYPDKFTDLMNDKFHLFFEQRIVLRCMIRYRQSYFTFTRGFSKSFLAFLSKYMICMFLPKHKAFIVAGTKAQAAQIAREKVIDDLWAKFPLLSNEMNDYISTNLNYLIHYLKNLSHLIHELGHAWASEKDEFVQDENGNYVDANGNPVSNVGTRIGGNATLSEKLMQNTARGVLTGSGSIASVAMRKPMNLIKTVGSNMGIGNTFRKGFENAVKTTCFLADIADFAAFNAVYAEYFISLPARSCVAAKDLPRGALVEVEAVAVEQTEVFAAAKEFARVEGILPAPWSIPAIKLDID